MYKGKKILALITARGGSKGIPRKNIKSLGGEPLINWTIRAAKASNYIDRLVVTTEDQEISSVAQKAGCEVPFLRPKELATDTSTSMDVIFHALSSIDGDYDYLLLLQPTSPFRKTHHIDSIIEQGIDTSALMTVSVSEVKKHPAFMYSLSKEVLVPVLEKSEHQRRQDMPPVYEYNGAMYFSKINHLKKVKSYNDKDVRAFLMGDIESVDIDTPLDWLYAEFILREGLLK